MWTEDASNGIMKMLKTIWIQWNQREEKRYEWFKKTETRACDSSLRKSCAEHDSTDIWWTRSAAWKCRYPGGKIFRGGGTRLFASSPSMSL